MKKWLAPDKVSQGGEAMQVSAVGLALNSHYQANRANLEDAMQRLSSGDRLVKAGVEPGSSLSISERFRLKIRNAEASTQSIQAAMGYLNTADAYGDTVTNLLQRMMELAASSTQEINTAADRKSLDLEFQAIKSEITNLSRNSSYQDKQTIGTGVIVSYDANTEHIKFWQSNGTQGQEIQRDFGAGAVDARQTEIGFDSTQSFSMSRDGRSLFYMGTVTGDPGGTVRIKRYDIDTHTVTAGSDLFSTNDTMVVDETGNLYINGSGTIYSVSTGDLSRTATAIADATASTEFTVYKGQVVYYRNDNTFVSADPGTGTPTVLTGPTAFGAGDHAFSGSGGYVAEESPAGSIRVIDTRTGNEATLAIGTANAVHDLRFSEDGDEIYYINKDTNSIHTLSVSTDSNDAVILADKGKLIQGKNANSFNGLDTGGANYAATINLVVAEDSVQTLKYGAIDLDLYALGLSNTRIDTLAGANAAISEVREASNRLNAARVQLRATASRFEFLLDGHRAWTANITNAESQIRDVDIAKEATEFSTYQVRTQAARAILTQFNTLSQNVLALLQ